MLRRLSEKYSTSTDINRTSLDFSCSLKTYGVFTLPDTETDRETEANTDTDKLAQNTIEICVCVCICSV